MSNGDGTQHVIVNEYTVDAGAGGYVRWRPRMVRLSAVQDITNTLTATGWMGSDLEYPMEVKEFFPEFAVYTQDAVHVNTIVVDKADPQGVREFELGGGFYQNYRINLAMYAQDEETGIGVFSDLSDRFFGLTDAPYVSLLDFNQADPPPLITRMEVVSFDYTKASLDVVPYEYHLWYAQLIVQDFVDGTRTEMPT